MNWKCYKSHPLGAIPSLYIQEYLQIMPAGVSVWLIYTTCTYIATHLPFTLANNHCCNTEPNASSHARNVGFGTCPSLIKQGQIWVWPGLLSRLVGQPGQWYWPGFNPNRHKWYFT